MTAAADTFALEHMNDALAASALVAALLAALFTYWQGEVQRVLDMSVSDDPKNNGGVREAVRSALRWRAVPLLLVSFATVAILAPRAWSILAHAVVWGQIRLYDDVQAMFVLTEVLILGLVVASAAQVVVLRAKLRKLG